MEDEPRPQAASAPAHVAEAVFRVDRRAHTELARESLRGTRLGRAWVPFCAATGLLLAGGGGAAYAAGSREGLAFLRLGVLFLIGAAIAWAVQASRVRRASREAELADPGIRHVVLFEEGALLRAGDTTLQYPWRDIEEILAGRHATLLIRRRNTQGVRGTVIPMTIEARGPSKEPITREAFIAEMQRLWMKGKAAPLWGEPERAPDAGADKVSGYS